jgi:glycerate dehydrogenase
MKIIVLDRCTVERENEINWESLLKLGEVEFYDLLSDSEVIEVAKEAEIIIANKKVFHKELLEKLPALRLICLFATGYNNIDIDAAREMGIVVSNAPGYSTDFVSQTVMAFILSFTNSVAEYNKDVHEDKWIKSKTFSFFTNPLIELTGKTLGIFGLGSIGKKVASLGKAFGMNVIASTRTTPVNSDIEIVSKEELFRRSDFLSIHCPLTPQTQGLVNRETLSLMKDTAYLINTSRGGTIIEKDLAEALNEGRIAGAAVDVLSEEPMKEYNPLRYAKNCIITPHVAWAAEETRQRLIGIVAANIEAYQKGKPQNVVNMPTYK